MDLFATDRLTTVGLTRDRLVTRQLVKHIKVQNGMRADSESALRETSGHEQIQTWQNITHKFQN